MVKDRLIGGVIDLRISPQVSPRIVLGRRSFEKIAGTDGTDEETFEVGVQFALSITGVK